MTTLIQITQLCQQAYDNSLAHGFWEDYIAIKHVLFEHSKSPEHDMDKYLTDTKLAKIDLMHSELGEMTEGVRKPGPDQHCPEFTQEEIELADCLIRAFDYAGAFGLRLAEAVEAKMAYNQSRPYKHGKKA